MPTYERLRRQALRSIKGGHTKSGTIHYGPGAALVVPVNTALARLVELHKRAVGETASSAHINSLSGWAARIIHRRETLGTLGTLLGVPRQARRSLTHSILKFAQKRRSLHGLESVVLSATFGLFHEEPLEAEKWHRLLREIGVPRLLGAGHEASPVLDPVTRQFTYFSSDALTQYLGGDGGNSQLVPRPDPGVIVSDDPSTCVRVATILSAGFGLAGGTALGGVAGGSVDNGHNNTAIILGIGGGAVAGFFGGAQGGQSFGQAVCPGSPSGTPAPGSSTGGLAPGDLPQGQWEDNLVSSTPEATPDPADQKDYGSGFDAGWAAATAGGGAVPSGGSDTFGAGFADGYGAAQAMQTLPGGGGTAGGGTAGGEGGTGEGSGSGEGPGTGEGPGSGEGSGSGEGPGSGEGSGPGSGSGEATGVSADDSDDGDVGDGPVSPGTGAIFHHFNPGGPGMDGLVSDEGDGGDDGNDGNRQSPLRSSGAPVVRLVNPPDPDNNPRALHELGTATLAQAALLTATIAERLSGVADM